MAEQVGLQVNDVVEVGGMRGMIREERNGKFRVAAGRTDHGIWVDSMDIKFIHRTAKGDKNSVCPNPSCGVVTFKYTEGSPMTCPFCGSNGVDGSPGA